MRRPTALPLALALFAAALPACRSERTSDADRLDIYTESAYVHWEQGDLDRAESQALKGLEIDRRNGPLNLMMGWILLRRDRRDDLLRAEQVFRRLLSNENGDTRAVQGLAATLERLAILHDEAADAVATGERETEAADPVVRAAELREDARVRYAESLDLYEEVLAERPDFIRALNGAVRTTAALERWDESLRYAERLIETVRNESEYWTSVLQRDELDPREEKSLQANVRGAAELLVDSHLFAATLLHDLGRSQEALQHLEHTIALDPGLPEAYSLRAQALHNTGQVREAVADLDHFIGISGKEFDHPDIRRALDLRTHWSRELQAGSR